MKEIILVITGTVKNAFWSFISLVQIARNYSKVNSIFYNIPIKKSLLVLGNGPSLNLKEVVDFQLLSDGDILVVNDFAYIEEFFRLKPKYYVLYDDYYFDSENVSEGSKLSLLYSEIFHRVDWPMYLIIPNIRVDFIEHFHQNWSGSIDIVGLNCVPFKGFDFLRSFMLRRNLTIFPIRNVIVAGLFIGINTHYKKIFLFGVDHDIISDLTVDEDNKVRLKVRHFYSGKTKAEIWKDAKGVDYTMSKALQDILVMFRGYEAVYKYSILHHVQIINMNPKSFIDAFPKKIE